METESQICLECSKPLVGRADKKYCNDYCRNAHYNKTNRVSNNFKRKINRILSQNREILAKMNPGETSKTRKTHLVREGFNFTYFTNLYETKTGKVYYFCYDKGYLYLEGDKIALVTKKDYVL